MSAGCVIFFFLTAGSALSEHLCKLISVSSFSGVLNTIFCFSDDQRTRECCFMTLQWKRIVFLVHPFSLWIAFLNFCAADNRTPLMQSGGRRPRSQAISKHSEIKNEGS
ncbi:hypothetical protein CEXT_637131 [Caerostris extrusa]|uniref:Secreted protein n=1 Tax=Caerostris extrusa TaxID=172846 RepID=A0AAV4T974_CAEEX|nr:hypothetical protein CEXT_637131 [Caerostris extrusa]